MGRGEARRGGAPTQSAPAGLDPVDPRGLGPACRALPLVDVTRADGALRAEFAFRGRRVAVRVTPAELLGRPADVIGALVEQGLPALPAPGEREWQRVLAEGFERAPRATWSPTLTFDGHEVREGRVRAWLLLDDGRRVVLDGLRGRDLLSHTRVRARLSEQLVLVPSRSNAAWRDHVAARGGEPTRNAVLAAGVAEVLSGRAVVPHTGAFDAAAAARLGDGGVLHKADHVYVAKAHLAAWLDEAGYSPPKRLLEAVLRGLGATPYRVGPKAGPRPRAWRLPREVALAGPPVSQPAPGRDTDPASVTPASDVTPAPTTKSTSTTGWVTTSALAAEDRDTVGADPPGAPIAGEAFHRRAAPPTPPRPHADDRGPSA